MELLPNKTGSFDEGIVLDGVEGGDGAERSGAGDGDGQWNNGGVIERRVSSGLKGSIKLVSVPCAAKKEGSWQTG